MQRISVRFLTVLGLASSLALLGACASAPPEDRPSTYSTFGESVRQARALQTMDPEAARKAGPMVGIDGEAGRSVIDAYQKGYKEPPRSFSLGLGGSSMGISSP